MWKLSVWLCSSVKLTLLGCTNTILHIAYSSWTLPRKKPPGNKKNFTAVSSSDISETYTHAGIWCARTGLYFSFIPQRNSLYSVPCAQIIQCLLPILLWQIQNNFSYFTYCFRKVSNTLAYVCIHVYVLHSLFAALYKISCILPHNYTCVCFSLKRRNRISLEHKGFVIIPMMMLLLVADSTSCFHVGTGSEALCHTMSHLVLKS